MTENYNRKDPREVSREELYRQVWRTPMSHLALEYGISGNGLVKICDRLKVPYPKRGYWARKAAGQKVITFRLPPGDEDTPQSVTISPTPPPPQPPKLPDEVQIKSESARAEATAIAVSDRLLRPHPIIARWLAEYDRKKREARLERDPWRKNLLKPTEWSESDRRRHRILDALFKGMEKQSARVQEDDRYQLFFEVNGEKIEVQIREKQKQTGRPLNENSNAGAPLATAIGDANSNRLASSSFDQDLPTGKSKAGMASAAKYAFVAADACSWAMRSEQHLTYDDARMQR